MEKIKDKSNNEILLELKQLQENHEAIKTRMIKDYDELEAIEKRFNDGNIELHNRLTGE